MNLRDSPKISMPAVFIFLSVFLERFLGGLYFLRGLEAPVVLTLLPPVVIAWAMWLWLRGDSRKRGVQWVLDLGWFLYVAWIVILPYHLFKTRGLKALIPILFFVLIALLGTVGAAIVSEFL